MNVGRAGRVRVQRRLAVARRGAELLDRKRHLLAEELERLELAADRAGGEWRLAAAEARRWAGRATALDGPSTIRLAAPASPAVATVTWGATMGVAFPVDASTRCPPERVVGGSSALVLAAEAHRAALDAGVAHAAALAAVGRVRAELAATRTRQRAVERHWIPRLEGELATIERALADLELEEALRLRWAAGAVATGRRR
ncbi:V-type ATP synthase subunit D [Isoptericola sp. b441]|uniref:V-type ATP synthase subunit D n=1 Tax=Actinotalea lenta TaxID=3064654 RepID=A0ABT9D8U3_9CELL|nr:MULTISPECIES: V-type ATP synthase subunit D [unclassified Isoptericola]MDO8106975.1 V-type ATP synthase subunit D [Isoptericola sp. b441]MDO8121315.1 V-type ATP synthase subunit D [Isoptericola sp. b490]